MSRLRSGSKVLASSTAVILLLLVCGPLQLAAQERESPIAHQVSVLDWVAGLWSDVATWLAGKAPAPPAGSGSAVVDGSCAIDPFGCPHGG